MDSSTNYIVVIISGDAWITGIFGDDWYANMKRIDLTSLSHSTVITPIIQVTIINRYEFRILMDSGILVSIQYGKVPIIIDEGISRISGTASLTNKREVVIDNYVVTDGVDDIFGKDPEIMTIVGGRIYPLNSNTPTIIHDIDIHYAVKGYDELLYVDVDGKLFSNKIQLKGIHTTYGVEKVLPFGRSERVILDRKGIIHFLGLKSNKSLRLNTQQNSNVLEAPFVAVDIGVFYTSTESGSSTGIILAKDQSERLWSITTSNPERIGWHPITEVNRYYNPQDPYPVTFV